MRKSEPLQRYSRFFNNLAKFINTYTDKHILTMKRTFDISIKFIKSKK